MPIRVALSHQSRYRYDRPVNLQPHVMRLRPAPHCRTSIPSYSMRVSPAEHFLNWQQDPFGNHQARLVFPKPTDELVVDVDLVAEMVAMNPFDFFVEKEAETHPFSYEPTLARELAPYLELEQDGPLLEAFVADVRRRHLRPGRRNVDVLVEINRDISQQLRYDLRMEPGVFAPDETLQRGHGSCRDFAWLEVQALRRLGFAARFVSGYSIQLKPDVVSLDGPAGVAQDVADLHAWVEVYLPGAGWIGLDATSGLLAGEGHIPLAATAMPSTAAPITGSYTWNERHDRDRVVETFTFEMRVQRLAEQPRVTRPYRDDQWQAIDRLGDAVDADLTALDVRLTMGGEPTFVSLDDRDADQWNTAALGPDKRELADKLVRRLRARFAPGGLLHHGQGKWYPGEPLPRWAFSCYFRRDGVPVWRDPALLADEKPAQAADAGDAERFAAGLARRLGIASELAVAAHEDVYYYLWRERRLPANVDVLQSRLDDPMERARLARLFGGALAAPVGYVLPLRARQAEGRIVWESAVWSLRGDRLFLLPGDSAMGFRLPLDALPWEPPERRDQIVERDPLEARPPLAVPVPGPGRPAQSAPATAEVVRTALCVEPREGILHVFMPPLGWLEEYLALVEAIEDVAQARRQPVRIEGYPPPSDPRLEKLSVTPDPGVIEVNVQPAHSWRQQCEITNVVYEEAAQCRLGTDKFMLDGRHTGTGGGNHVVLGGPTPADSPFLRRPDLLRSFIGYTINHPSLSYLFSGLFVGPTSQAPRPDEARQDSIHELELAFAQIPSQGTAPPW
ncbi:MAG TPA: transglutaminase family protein, partial [Polyangia bacterium]|nr:transglutaminase family protein [Polyangia bacterium]